MAYHVHLSPTLTAAEESAVYALCPAALIREQGPGRYPAVTATCDASTWDAIRVAVALAMGRLMALDGRATEGGCPHCGGHLILHPGAETALCPDCGTEWISADGAIVDVA